MGPEAKRQQLLGKIRALKNKKTPKKFQAALLAHIRQLQKEIDKLPPSDAFLRGRR